jgi:hypothetical protein
MIVPVSYQDRAVAGLSPLARLRAKGWSVDRTAACVWVWRWVDGERIGLRRFTSVIRAARILLQEVGA